MTDILTNKDYDILKRLASGKAPSPEKYLAEMILENAGLKRRNAPLSETLTKQERRALPVLTPDMEHGLRRMAQAYWQDKNGFDADDVKKMFSDAIKATGAREAEPAKRRSKWRSVGDFFKNVAVGFTYEGYERQVLSAALNDEARNVGIANFAGGLAEDIESGLESPLNLVEGRYTDVTDSLSKGYSKSLKSAVKLLYEKKHKRSESRAAAKIGQTVGRALRIGLQKLPVASGFLTTYMYPDSFVQSEYERALESAEKSVKRAEQSRENGMNWRQLEKGRERGGIKKKMRREAKISQIRAVLQKADARETLSPAQNMLYQALRAKGVSSLNDLSSRTWYGRKRVNTVRDLPKRLFSLDKEGGVAAVGAPRMAYCVENVAQAYNKRAHFEVRAKSVEQNDEREDGLTTAERMKALDDAKKAGAAAGAYYGLKAVAGFFAGETGATLAGIGANYGVMAYKKAVDFKKSFADFAERRFLGRANREKQNAKEMQVRALFEAIEAKAHLTDGQRDLLSFLRQNGVNGAKDLKSKAVLKFVRTNVPKRLFEQHDGEESRLVDRVVTAKESQFRHVLEKAAAKENLTANQAALLAQLRSRGIKNIAGLSEKTFWTRTEKLSNALNKIDDKYFEKDANGAIVRQNHASDAQKESDARRRRIPPEDELNRRKEMQARLVLLKTRHGDPLSEKETLLRDALRQKGIANLKDWQKKRKKIAKIKSAAFDVDASGDVKKLNPQLARRVLPALSRLEEEARLRQAQAVLEKNEAKAALSEKETALLDVLTKHGIQKASDLRSPHFFNRAFVKKLDERYLETDDCGRPYIAMSAKETQMRGVLEKDAKHKDLTRDEAVLLALMNEREIYTVADLYRKDERGAAKIDGMLSLSDFFYTRGENGCVTRFETESTAHDDILNRAAYPVSQDVETTRTCYKRFRNVKKGFRKGAMMRVCYDKKDKENNAYKPYAKLRQATLLLHKIDSGARPEDLRPAERDLYDHLTSSEVGIRSVADLRDAQKRNYVRLGIPSKLFEKDENGRLKGVDANEAKEIQIRAVLNKKQRQDAVLSPAEAALAASLHAIGVDSCGDLKSRRLLSGFKKRLDVALKLPDEAFVCDELGFLIAEPPDARNVPPAENQPERDRRQIDGQERRNTVSPAKIQSAFKKAMDNVDIYEMAVEKPRERAKSVSLQKAKTARNTLKMPPASSRRSRGDE